MYKIVIQKQNIITSLVSQGGNCWHSLVLVGNFCLIKDPFLFKS